MTKQRGKRPKPSPAVPGPSQRVRKEPPRSRDSGEEAHLPWGRKNYLILGIGIAVLVVGFLLLVLGDTTIAPILLVAGYLGLIPWGIIASRGDSTPAAGGSTEANRVRGE